MTLEDFVAETLQQIMSGVTKAKRADGRVAVAKKVTMTAPPGSSTAFFTAPTPNYDVEFDVAVTVTDKLEGGMKGQLAVVAGSAGHTHENSKVSRVKFSVPLDLTSDLS
jgi:hypothetical protein